MSILPVLGHKPITSYFSRTSSTKRKRTEVDKPGPPSTEGFSKRPKQSAISSSSSIVDTRTTEAIGDAMKKANGSSYSSMDPCTPLGNQSGRPSLDGTLPTPPMTCMAPFRSRKGLEKDPSSSVQRSEISSQEDQPPPPKHFGLSNSTIFQPSGTFSSLLVVSNFTSAMQELTIPSSQSQDTPSIGVDMFAPFSKYSGENSSLKPARDEGLVIESSQSQLLIMASPNVRILELEPTLPAFDVVIPSSQSQEKELTIPTEKDMVTGTRGRSLAGTAQRDIPQRTLSDELFSVPIRDSILDNLFSDQQAALDNNPDACNPETLADSETEDGHECSPNKERSPGPTSPSPAARASSVSPSSLGVGSYSSLPPEVWEFRKMFENGDESYPADFPESLRS